MNHRLTALNLLAQAGLPLTTGLLYNSIMPGEDVNPLESLAEGALAFRGSSRVNNKMRRSGSNIDDLTMHLNQDPYYRAAGIMGLANASGTQINNIISGTERDIPSIPNPYSMIFGKPQ